MDGLSAAASGIAVVSLAIQLADSVKKLYEFWHAVREAPESIAAIATHLRVLKTVLVEIATHDQRYGADPVTDQLLESCEAQVKKMVAITAELEGQLQTPSRLSRKWTSVKASLKWDEVKSLLNYSKQIQVTLVLARQTSFERARQCDVESQNQIMMTLTQNMSTLQAQASQSSRPMSVPMGLDISSQVAFLQSETRRMASGMRNPLLRSAFERGMEVAIDQVIQGSPPDKQRRPTGGSAFSHVTPEAKSHISNGNGRQPAIPTLWTKRKSLINRSTTTKRNPFGKFTFCTRSFRVTRQYFEDTVTEDDDVNHQDDICQEETEISFTAVPSSWLVKLGLRSQLQFVGTLSTQGWKHIVHIFRRVGDDAPIFNNIKLGRVDLVKDILRKKEFTLHDVNSWGYTPLHYACYCGNLEISKLLLSAGADPSLRTTNRTTCFDTVLFAITGNVSVTQDDAIENLRFFLSLIDSEIELDDYLFALRLLQGFIEEKSRIFQWLFNTMKLRVAADELYGVAAKLLLRGAIFGYPLMNMQLVLEPFECAVDAVEPDGNYPPLLAAVAWRNFLNARFLVGKGANMHIEGLEHFQSPIAETPTSLAFYTPYVFFKWREIVSDGFPDLETFVEIELGVTSEGPVRRLRRDGWEVQSLLRLFQLELEFEQQPHAEHLELCPKCARYESTWVDLSWQKLLHQINRGEDIGDVYEQYKSSETQDQESRLSQKAKHSDSGQSDQAGGGEASVKETAPGFNDAEKEDFGDASTTSDCSEFGKSSLDDVHMSNLICVHCWHRLKDDKGGISDEVIATDEEFENSPMLLPL